MRTARTRVGDLVTYVWLPEGRTRAVLVERTPYGAARRSSEARGWTARGVGLVVQDVRGRHESPGLFLPYAEDRTTDGPDLLAWVHGWSDVPVVLLGTSYGAHAAIATATATAPTGGPDAVVVVVPALGLGETTRTRGGVLQLASRLGWWLANDVRRPWADVVAAARADVERAAAVSRLRCPLLAIGGSDDYFAHDTVDLWATWGGPARLVLGPWAHELDGARRADRILGWLEEFLDSPGPRGVELIDRSGAVRRHPPPMAVVHVDPAEAGDADAQWCASLVVRRPDGTRREVAHGAARGTRITLGPVVLTDTERSALEVTISPNDFPRYARCLRPSGTVPDHHLELTA